MDTDGEITSLGSNARTNYKAFKDSAWAYSATLCIEHYGTGLNHFHLTLTDREYAALGLVMMNEHGIPELVDGVPQPQPRELMPAKPARPHGNVGAPLLAYWKADEITHASVSLGASKLRQDILKACGKLICTDLSVGPGGIAAKTLPAILLYLEDKYGTLTEDDIRGMREKLRQNFTSATKFTEEASRFKINVAALEAGGERMSQTQLIEIFAEVTRAVMGIPPIIARYKRRVAIVANRQIVDLMDAIEAEIPQITSAEANFANAANQLMSPSEISNNNFAMAATSTTQLDVFMKAIQERLDNMESSIRATGRGRRDTGRGRGDGRGDVGRGGAAGRGSAAGRGNGPGTGNQERPTLYCFEHGYQKSHLGTACHHMKNDVSYTPAMKTAMGPCNINGFEGKK